GITFTPSALNDSLERLSGYGINPMCHLNAVSQAAGGTVTFSGSSADLHLNDEFVVERRVGVPLAQVRVTALGSARTGTGVIRARYNSSIAIDSTDHCSVYSRVVEDTAAYKLSHHKWQVVMHGQGEGARDLAEASLMRGNPQLLEVKLNTRQRPHH